MDVMDTRSRTHSNVCARVLGVTMQLYTHTHGRKCVLLPNIEGKYDRRRYKIEQPFFFLLDLELSGVLLLICLTRSKKICVLNVEKGLGLLS